ncbi:hypothetical protein C0966_07500 [Bacillus methanolicus]|uniref:SH3 domain-containing protein n=1 Tax=Bacillus methanolicus TaxID=1471 RepID=UPI0023800720|nr:SH3 domain-containing protein [Bacillus methanolicus]MDE3839201.1 hypothetical protein [Bacillus methanolicus]
MKKFLFLCAFLMLSLVITQTSLKVHAEEDIIRKNLITITNDVEVKRGATINYPTVFTLKKDTRVYVRDTFVGSDGRKWVSVVTHGYKSGWALLEKFKVPSPEAGRKAFITDQVEIRRGAHRGYEPVATLQKGMIVTQVDTFMTFSGQLWHKVDTGRKQGWLESQYFYNYVNYHGEGTISGKNGVVRRGASTDYSVKATLSQGTKVNTFAKFLNSRGEIWYHVQTPQGIYGWIKSSEISVRLY